MNSQAEQADSPFAHLIDLAQARLGACPVEVSDEFFAPCERMLQADPAVFHPDRYDDHGKWMDGWESRRRRDTGHDYAVLRLGLAGRLRGVDIDTSHFTGNYPPSASIDACNCPGGNPGADTVWTRVLPTVGLRGNQHHYHPLIDAGVFTHVRLNIYPDGGVARLRVYGEPECNWDQRDPALLIDLLALENGGRAITCNDQHFGSIGNLNLPGPGLDMGDGWETRRRREPGNDWAILALGHPGRIEAVEVDTAFFKGNFPDRCSIQAALLDDPEPATLAARSMFWAELMPPQKLEMDSLHRFEGQLADLGPVSHVRLNIIPDGGVSRLRLYGRIARKLGG